VAANAVHLRIFCLFCVQNKISLIAKNPAIARFFNYQKPLSIRISGLTEQHYWLQLLFYSNERESHENPKR
ncbi:hypothetical protein, partial [Photobacterium damselae]|uniref:hypothetical protein n=1 Tax=Photobacterium damselae TaxID=38293 RepID=UPI002F3E3D77